MQTIKCVLIWCIKAGTNQANFKKTAATKADGVVASQQSYLN